jgi:GntR family transcriptional regulator / MocR family aminotransferase
LNFPTVRRKVDLFQCHFLLISPVHLGAPMELILDLIEGAGSPLHRQVYAGIRRAILEGRIAPGQRVPSTRALAERLGISRATVSLAYEQLASEGYLEAAQGSGTCVGSQLPDDLLRPARERAAVSKRSSSGPAHLSPGGAALLRMTFPRLALDELPFDFRHGRPALDAFPFEVWNRLLARHGRVGSRAMRDYERDPRGHGPLRAAIAEHLRQARAVQCAADQVIITGGAQQALDLCARVLAAPDETAALEDPGYPGASAAFLAQGLRLIPLPATREGVSFEPLRAGRGIRLVYVTPSHQYPTGSVMSLPKRLELLELSRKGGWRILEDDYDSEFRYAGRPLPSLQGLDAHGGVLYVGTFSKAMFPALRVGYLVAPPDLVEVLARARWAADRQTPSLEQYALDDFIREGHLERHIRRMRLLYSRRREVLMEELAQRFAGRVTLWGESAGLHLMVRFRTGLSDAELVRRALAVGVGLESTEGCRIAGRGHGGEFLLRFGCLDEATIREGLRRLASVMG